MSKFLKIIFVGMCLAACVLFVLYLSMNKSPEALLKSIRKNSI